MKKIGAFLLKRLRLAFLKREHFFGHYADNFIQMKKFVADRNIIVLHYHSDSLSANVIIPHVEKNKEMINALVSEQIRVFRREFRKEKKAILFYVEDHFITRLLGYKETIDHTRLAS